MNWEYTNATTTQLGHVNTDDRDDTLLAWTGAKRAGSVAPRTPGNVIGDWIYPQGQPYSGGSRRRAHDTASAVGCLSAGK